MTRQSTKASGQRQLRVGEEIRHALALLMERTSFRDPDLFQIPITVTEVQVSPDLRNALVFIVPLGGGDSARVLASLKRIRPFLRRALARMVQLQFAPDLSFKPDNCFETASHIEQILCRPEVQRDLQTEGRDLTLEDIKLEEHILRERDPGKIYEKSPQGSDYLLLGENSIVTTDAAGEN